MPDQRSEYNGSERSEPRAEQARPTRKEWPPAASASYTRPPRVQQSAAGATNQPDARVRKPTRESFAGRRASSWAARYIGSIGQRASSAASSASVGEPSAVEEVTTVPGQRSTRKISR